jgi:hypothetical protein
MPAPKAKLLTNNATDANRLDFIASLVRHGRAASELLCGHAPGETSKCAGKVTSVAYKTTSAWPPFPDAELQ